MCRKPNIRWAQKSACKSKGEGLSPGQPAQPSQQLKSGSSCRKRARKVGLSPVWWPLLIILFLVFGERSVLPGVPATASASLADALGSASGGDWSRRKSAAKSFEPPSSEWRAQTSRWRCARRKQRRQLCHRRRLKLWTITSPRTGCVVRHPGRLTVNRIQSGKSKGQCNGSSHQTIEQAVQSAEAANQVNQVEPPLGTQYWVPGTT